MVLRAAFEGLWQSRLKKGPTTFPPSLSAAAGGGRGEQGDSCGGGGGSSGGSGEKATVMLVAPSQSQKKKEKESNLKEANLIMQGKSRYEQQHNARHAYYWCRWRV